jgi:hypothetical protein
VGPLSTLLALPVRGPIGALTWLARQVADAAMREMLDPVRIEAALLALERRLDAGEIDEAAFEAEETRLLEELAEMRAWQAEIAAGHTEEQASEEQASEEQASEEQAPEEQAPEEQANDEPADEAPADAKPRAGEPADPWTDARRAAADPAAPASGEAGAWMLA